MQTTMWNRELVMYVGPLRQGTYKINSLYGSMVCWIWEYIFQDVSKKNHALSALSHLANFLNSFIQNGTVFNITTDQPRKTLWNDAGQEPGLNQAASMYTVLYLTSRRFRAWLRTKWWDTVYCWTVFIEDMMLCVIYELVTCAGCY